MWARGLDRNKFQIKKLYISRLQYIHSYIHVECGKTRVVDRTTFQIKTEICIQSLDFLENMPSFESFILKNFKMQAQDFGAGFSFVERLNFEVENEPEVHEPPDEQEVSGSTSL